MISDEITFIDSEDDIKLKYHSKYCIIINDILLNQIVSKNKNLTNYVEGMFYHTDNMCKYHFTNELFFTNINYY